MAMQPIVDLGGSSFLDRMPPASREQILVNSTRIRYPAGTIAFSPETLTGWTFSKRASWTEAKVDTKNPDRGPLLIINGQKDNTVPWAIANASYKQQKRNQAVTEIIEMPNRGHALVIDSVWREVADTALAFVKRFVT